MSTNIDTCANEKCLLNGSHPARKKGGHSNFECTRGGVQLDEEGRCLNDVYSTQELLDQEAP